MERSGGNGNSGCLEGTVVGTENCIVFEIIALKIKRKCYHHLFVRLHLMEIEISSFRH